MGFWVKAGESPAFFLHLPLNRLPAPTLPPQQIEKLEEING